MKKRMLEKALFLIAFFTIVGLVSYGLSVVGLGELCFMVGMVMGVAGAFIWIEVFDI